MGMSLAALAMVNLQPTKLLRFPLPVGKIREYRCKCIFIYFFMAGFWFLNRLISWSSLEVKN